MANYFNPISKIDELARRIYPLEINFDTIMAAEIKEDEVLLCFGDRGIFKQAMHAENQELFDEYYGQYRDGYLVEFRMYAMPKSSWELGKTSS